MISENPEKREKSRISFVLLKKKEKKSRVKFIVTGTLVGSNLTRYN